MAALKYRKIHKYIVKAECTSPLHIGAASGEKSEVLVHPVSNLPFVQASSLAGVLRKISDLVNSKADTEALFGSSHLKEGDNANEFSSRLKISDGQFALGTVRMELRPRVAINPQTGSVDSSQIAGSGAEAGHKFEMESIAAGAEISFDLYLFDDELKNSLESIFAELKGDTVQIGGQKSNGEGFIKLKSLHYRCFDMTMNEDRKLWFKEEDLEITVYTNIYTQLGKAKNSSVAYTITIKGQTEGSLLVKGIAVTEGFGKDYPDTKNLQNADKEYIVPGSSMKGAIRAQMTRIAKQLGIEAVIPKVFGYTETNGGSMGCVQVLDVTIGNREDNDKAASQYHIHIDKFTGGVIGGELFSEKNTCGDMSIGIKITKSDYEKVAAGLMLLTARDLAAGMFNIGSGYGTGKGFVDVEKIVIEKESQKAIISIANGWIEDKNGLIPACLGAIEQYKKGAF